MSSSSTSITTDNYPGGGGTAITAVHQDIIQTQILTRLDGPSLASAGCASSQFHNLCSEEKLWKNICNSSWPSTADPRVHEVISRFASAHRSFFSDSFPTLYHHDGHRPRATKSVQNPQFQTPELISAVDIHYGDTPVYSKVVSTKTETGWFLCSPFRIDILDQKETVKTRVKLEGDEDTCLARIKEQMRLSWIIIDPAKKRSGNLSSLRPVAVKKHWLTGDIQVLYATVLAASCGELVQCGILVTCEGKEGGELSVREVSMQVEDMEGKIVSGKDSLVILQDAMAGERKNWKGGKEKERYDRFLELRKEWRERKQTREKRLDMVCIVSGVTIFMAFWTLFLFR